MDAKEFKDEIKETDDKIEFIKENSKDLNLSMKELIQILKETFSDEEKIEFLGRFNVAKIFRKDLMESIESDEVKLGLLENEKFTKEFEEFEYKEIIYSFSDSGKMDVIHNEEIKEKYKFDKNDIIWLIQLMGDKEKKKCLNDSELLEEYKFNKFNIQQIILSMTDETKKEYLNDSELLEKIKLEKSSITKIISSMSEKEVKEILNNPENAKQLWNLSENNFSSIINCLKNEEERLDYIGKCGLKDSEAICSIVKNLSDEKILENLTSKRYNFNNNQISIILSKFEVDDLFKVIEEQKDFLKQNKISIYGITTILKPDKQLEFVAKMENADLSINDKRKILATLEVEAKSKIDRQNMREEYISALNMKKSGNMIKFDIEKNIKEYEGLDEILFVEPQDIDFEKRDRLKELAERCPKVKFRDRLKLASSTAQEFLNAEKWIDEILEGIDENWTNLQKLAYIDNKIGKKISYSPDFETEVSDAGDARALWRIIDSGYGVCNGIAQIEQYILGMVGIEAEMASSQTHSFLKLKNMEIPREDGSIIVTDIIQDPTWNLAAYKYEGIPENFCRSYEEIRKHDIKKDGTDRNCHKNDEELSDVKIDLEEKILREVFSSIGLADKEGNFPISDMLDESDKIAAENISLEEKVKKQLELLKRIKPDFEKCKNETMSILAGNLLDHDEMEFEKCIVKRVFDKEDSEKNPVLYVYCDMPEQGKKFFVAKDGDFVEMEKEEFINKYECYSMDLEENKGVPHWEENNVEEDLTKSSGKIVAAREEEGDER